MTAARVDLQSVVPVDAGEGVLHLRLNRPAKRNAFDLPMLHELTGAVTEGSASARALVISGGSFFSAGADISVYAEQDCDKLIEITRAAALLIDTVATAPVPVIVAMEGMALGGGFELVLAADLVVAGETAQMGLPEVALGLIPGWGGTQRLSAQIGTRRAKELIMLQRRVDAEEARALGLVNEVVPAGESIDRALTLARQLAISSATALAATKDLVSHAERALCYESERAQLLRLFESRDGVEGVAAFVEKRPAVFTNGLEGDGHE